LALQSGDVAQVKARATAAGFASLMHGVGDDDPAVTFMRWGKGWAGWAIRWQETTDLTARASLGPEVKEHGVRLVKGGSGWKLDRWTLGE